MRDSQRRLEDVSPQLYPEYNFRYSDLLFSPVFITCSSHNMYSFYLINYLLQKSKVLLQLNVENY